MHVRVRVPVQLCRARSQEVQRSRVTHVYVCLSSFQELFILSVNVPEGIKRQKIWGSVLSRIYGEIKQKQRSLKMTAKESIFVSASLIFLLLTFNVTIYLQLSDGDTQTQPSVKFSDLCCSAAARMFTHPHLSLFVRIVKMWFTRGSLFLSDILTLAGTPERFCSVGRFFGELSRHNTWNNNDRRQLSSLDWLVWIHDSNSNPK